MKEWEDDVQVLSMSHFYLGEYVSKLRTHGTRLGQVLFSFVSTYTLFQLFMHFALELEYPSWFSFVNSSFRNGKNVKNNNKDITINNNALIFKIAL